MNETRVSSEVIRCRRAEEKGIEGCSAVQKRVERTGADDVVERTEGYDEGEGLEDVNDEVAV